MTETHAPDRDITEPAGADGAVRTVSRVARLLLLLARAGEAGARVTDLALALGLAKPTVHRLLTALTESGLAAHMPASRRYRLGALAGVLGQAGRRIDLASVCRDSLDRLAALTGDTVYLSVREDTAALCVASATGAFPVRTLTLAVGDFRPLGVGAGSLALLAAMPDADIARCLQHNAQWLTRFPRMTEAWLRDAVVATRRDGYAANQDGIVQGMSALGVLVRDAAGEPIAALSIAAITDRLTPPRRDELVALLQREAAHCRDRLIVDAGLNPLPNAPTGKA